jgi:RNA polymerase sigma-70 factor (ECF subfamily)
VEAIVPSLFQVRSQRASHRDAEPATDASDADLVAEAARDPRAFALLYARYLDPIHRYCYRRLGAREAAEDATSLVFTKALSALPRYHDTSFRAWLFTIAHHVVTDHYRAARPDQPIEKAVALTDGAPSPEELVLAADDRRSIQEFLTRLPEHQRQVIELRLAGLTGAEIAHVLGRTPANINVTQHRAVARLRALLDAQTTRHHAKETADGES